MNFGKYPFVLRLIERLLPFGDNTIRDAFRKSDVQELGLQVEDRADAEAIQIVILRIAKNVCGRRIRFWIFDFPGTNP